MHLLHYQSYSVDSSRGAFPYHPYLPVVLVLPIVVEKTVRLSGLDWEHQCIFSTQSEIGLFPASEESLYSHASTASTQRVRAGGLHLEVRGSAKLDAASAKLIPTGLSRSYPAS